MDKSSVIGVLLAIAAIVTGLLIEGGSLRQILQPTAAMIVFGGTLGAVMLQFPLPTVISAFKKAVQVFLNHKKDGDQALKLIVDFANKARSSGIVSLDQDLDRIHDPFLKQAIMLAVDGTEPSELRKIMEIEIEKRAEDQERIPAIFESAGGFSPTIGIIGAVLGLIHVMSNLSDIAAVGEGIAGAFVATIYGVAVANIIFLPLGGRIKLRLREEITLKELTLVGVLAILEGMNPKLVKERLSEFVHTPGGAKPGAAPEAAGAT